MNVFNKKNKDPFLIKEKKFKYGNLQDSFYHLAWMEDSFLFGEDDKETLKKTFDLGKIKHIFSFLFFVFFVLVARLAWLQIIKGEDYQVLAEGNRVRVESLEPKRGIIYDSKMQPLVKNEANFVLYLIPADMPRSSIERDEILRSLAFVIDNTFESDSQEITRNDEESSVQLLEDSDYFYLIKDRVDKIRYGSLESFRPLFILDNIDHSSAMKIMLETESMPGISLSVKMGRAYLNNTSSLLSLSHLVGYTGKVSEKDMEIFGSEYSLIDYIGKTGLELFYENELKGEKGKVYIEVDALGREKRVIDKIEPIDGYNLVLNIDTDLQAKIEDILIEALDENDLSKASVVALDPNNGKILALVSWPAYDNNMFSYGISQDNYSALINNPNRPLFNRAVSGSFPSGSTLKMNIAAAALEEGIITERTTVMSSGGINVGPWRFPDWRAGGHGITNIKKAIAESVNTFFYYIGGGYQSFKGLGIDKIVEYLSLFGLGLQSGIDLPQEARGFIPTPDWKKELRGESWYIGNTYHVSIGQGDILVSPLQVANFTAVFANGGTLYRPQIVNRIIDNEGRFIRENEADIIRTDFIQDRNIDIVREGMRQTITAGSARRLGVLPFEVAGKTGTAQWSSGKSPHAWFTSFAPYDKPEIVLTVLIEEGSDADQLAVTISSDILSYYFLGEPEEPVNTDE